MRIQLSSLALAAIVALTGCQPASEYTESEASHQLKVDEATTRVDLRFGPGSDRLVAADVARLRAMAAAGKLAPADRVLVSAGGGPQLAAARVAAVSEALLPYGIVASPGALAGVPSNRAVVEAQRYLVSLPPCPNWSKPPAHDFTNAAGSNFGCANVSNFGRMVANPADLVSGQPLGLAAGKPAQDAVDRYLNDIDPKATGIKPYIGGTGGAASAAQGAGGAGGGAGGQTGS